MRVVFSNRAYAAVLAETTEKITTETGGLFLGTVIDDTWYIIEAIDPGPKSIFEVAYFEYDQKYTQHLINKIANLYEKKLDLIGLWHRHPGSFDQFSSTDNGTNAKYASMRVNGAISALVNIDPKFRITMYHVGQPCRYRKITYEVGDQLILEELLKFKSPERFHEIMDKLTSASNSRQRDNDEYKISVSLASFMKFILPMLADTECTDVETNNLVGNESTKNLLVDAVVDDLAFLAEVAGVETSVTLSDNYLIVYQEAIDKTSKIYFMYSVVKDCVVFSYENKCYTYQKGTFTEAFGKAKAQKDAEKREIQAKPERKRPGVRNPIIKIINLNRNGE